MSFFSVEVGRLRYNQKDCCMLSGLDLSAVTTDVRFDCDEEQAVEKNVSWSGPLMNHIA